MTPTLSSKIAELRELEKAATPAPWQNYGKAYVNCGNESLIHAGRNAELLIAARNALPELLKDVEELEVERDAMREVLDHLLMAAEAMAFELMKLNITIVGSKSARLHARVALGKGEKG